MSRELLQQALDALKYHTEHTYPFHLTNVAIELLEKELAKPEQGEVVVTKNPQGQIVAVTRQDAEGRILKVIDTSAKPEQEPVAWVTDEFAITYTADVAQRWRDKGWKVVPFYTAPPLNPWVGLTSEDWENTPDTGKKGCERDAELFDWIEQTLKDKNT
jgi:hypothetical protein